MEAGSGGRNGKLCVCVEQEVKNKRRRLDPWSKLEEKVMGMQIRPVKRAQVAEGELETVTVGLRAAREGEQRLERHALDSELVEMIRQTLPQPFAFNAVTVNRLWEQAPCGHREQG